MRLACATHGALPFPSAAPTDDEVAAALRRQVDAGMAVITDGRPGWRDPVTPQLAGLAGIRFGAAATLPLGIPLAARPVVEAKLRRLHAPMLDTFRRAAPHAARPLKAVLTGPYTIAAAAEIATTAYHHRADLAVHLGTLLAQDVTALVVAGAQVIQIDEPLLLARPEDAKLVRVLLEPLVDAAIGATVVVATYGADAGGCYAQLNTLPGDLVAIDCAGRPEVIAAIAETGSGKPLALGIVDAARADLEPVADLVRLLDRLLARYGHDTVWLQPSAGLQALPIATAEAKLRALAAAAAAFTSP